MEDITMMMEEIAVSEKISMNVEQLITMGKQCMDGIPVLDVEEVYAVTKNTFVVTFDSKSLSGVDAPETPL